MILLITGGGKGKTTSAIGQAIRALGRGRQVFFAQFIKSDGYPSGEDKMLREMPGVTFLKGGKGFVGILGDKLPFEEHRAAALDTLSQAREASASGKYGLIVLDEANVAVSLKLISEDELVDFADKLPAECDLVLTGRGATPRLIERADIVTLCEEVKHPYQQDVKAKKGIEY